MRGSKREFAGAAVAARAVNGVRAGGGEMAYDGLPACGRARSPRKGNEAMRYSIAVMAMLALAFAPGAFANTEAGSQCASSPPSTCAAAPDDAFLLATGCASPYSYEVCANSCIVVFQACMPTARGYNARELCRLNMNSCMRTCRIMHCGY